MPASLTRQSCVAIQDRAPYWYPVPEFSKDWPSGGYKSCPGTEGGCNYDGRAALLKLHLPEQSNKFENPAGTIGKPRS